MSSDVETPRRPSFDQQMQCCLASIGFPTTLVWYWRAVETGRIMEQKSMTSSNSWNPNPQTWCELLFSKELLYIFCDTYCFIFSSTILFVGFCAMLITAKTLQLQSSAGGKDQQVCMPIDQLGQVERNRL